MSFTAHKKLSLRFRISKSLSKMFRKFFQLSCFSQRYVVTTLWNVGKRCFDVASISLSISLSISQSFSPPLSFLQGVGNTSYIFTKELATSYTLQFPILRSSIPSLLSLRQLDIRFVPFFDISSNTLESSNHTRSISI